RVIAATTPARANARRAGRPLVDLHIHKPDWRAIRRKTSCRPTTGTARATSCTTAETPGQVWPEERARPADPYCRAAEDQAVDMIRGRCTRTSTSSATSTGTTTTTQAVTAARARRLRAV